MFGTCVPPCAQVVSRSRSKPTPGNEKSLVRVPNKKMSHISAGKTKNAHAYRDLLRERNGGELEVRCRPFW